MNRQEAQGYLDQKIAVLQKIKENTEIQLRFVRRREMRGLQRLFNERGKLILTLADLNNEDFTSGNWQQDQGFKPVIKVLRVLEKEILQLNSQVLEAALSEKERLALELNKVRGIKKIQKHYIRRWFPWKGIRLNIKG